MPDQIQRELRRSDPASFLTKQSVDKIAYNQYDKFNKLNAVVGGEKTESPHWNEAGSRIHMKCNRNL